MLYHVLGVKPKRGYVFWLFFKIGLLSAISFERSRRELSIDVAQHMPMFRYYQNTRYPRFSLIPETGIAFPKRGSRFYCKVFHTYFRYAGKTGEE